jgi:hypothetical protein
MLAEAQNAERPAHADIAGDLRLLDLTVQEDR